MACRDDADARHALDELRVAARGRIVLQEHREPIEEVLRVERVDLIADGRLHVDRLVDLPDWWSVRLPERTERDERVLPLQRVHFGEIFRRLLREGPADEPHHVRRRADERRAGHVQRSLPVRAGDDVALLVRAGGALARREEHVGPGAEHRHEEVPSVLVGKREHVRLLAQVEPGIRVQRVGVRRGDVVVRRIRICGHVGELAHRRALVAGDGDVRRDAPSLIHRHERIAVDVRLHRDPRRVLRQRLALRLRLAACADRDQTGECDRGGGRPRSGSRRALSRL